ncbi:hypothetical protein [Streptomyces sp. NPDC016845]|uniref:hypothetical protein n=1 Tax=Streptomyces sp. NPDC016845 TaxID=3364972 RepID=UPI0037B49928
MSNTTPPPQPDFPPQAPPPAKKRSSNTVIIGAAAAVIAAVIGTGIFVVQSRDDDKPAAAATASSTPSEEVEDAAVEDEAEVDAEPTDVYTPAAEDFEMTLKTTSKQCFGTAGCNLTVEPDLSYGGLSDSLDPAAVYEITYEITGDESGPVIETAELSDQTSLNFTPTVLQTSSSGKKVSVEITDVSVTGE